MKITLTIEVDNANNVTVTQADNKNMQNVPTIPEVEVAPADSIPVITTIGEVLPKGKHQEELELRPRTEEYPFNVADVKRVMQENDVNIPQLCRALGNFPASRMRNLFRYDSRRFNKKDYSIILRAIEEVKKSREI